MIKKILNASEMGKLGGEARAKTLTPERRKEIAIKASKTRWNKVEKLSTEMLDAK